MHLFDSNMKLWGNNMHLFGSNMKLWGTNMHLFGTNMKLWGTKIHFFGSNMWLWGTKKHSLGTNMHLLKGYRPSDSFCTFFFYLRAHRDCKWWSTTTIAQFSMAGQPAHAQSIQINTALGYCGGEIGYFFPCSYLAD